MKNLSLFFRKESFVVANLNSPVLDETNISEENFIPGPAFDEEKKVLNKYGSSDSGASLGDIFTDALNKKKSN